MEYRPLLLYLKLKWQGSPQFYDHKKDQFYSVCACVSICMFITLFSLEREKVFYNYLLMMWLVNLNRDYLQEGFLGWESPINTNATKQKKWDRASPHSPLIYGHRTGSGWGPQKGKQLGPAGTAQATSHQPVLQRIWGYPEAAGLPPNQILNSSRAGNTSFIVFLYPYGVGWGGDFWASKPARSWRMLSAPIPSQPPPL